jgi:hypothetical protein
VPAIFRTLELDHHEIRALVNAEQIDSPLAFIPFAKLLGNDKRMGRDHFDMLPEEPLEIAPLIDVLGGEGGLIKLGNRGLGEFVKRHGASCGQFEHQLSYRHFSRLAALCEPNRLKPFGRLVV